MDNGPHTSPASVRAHPRFTYSLFGIGNDSCVPHVVLGTRTKRLPTIVRTAVIIDGAFCNRVPLTVTDAYGFYNENKINGAF